MDAVYERVLAAASGALFPMLSMRDATALRAVSRTARAEVARHPWTAYAIVLRWDEWDAAFPQARGLWVFGPDCVPHRIAARIQHLKIGRCCRRSYDEATACVRTLLSDFPQLRVLDTAFTSRFAPQSVLPLVPRLRELCVNDCSLQDNDVRQLAAMLPQLPCLEMLKMRNNLALEPGMTTLAQSLVHVPKLQVLDVSLNILGTQGGLALAASLAHLPQLTVLAAERILAGSVVTSAIVAALPHVPRLRVLNVNYAYISPTVWLALMAALAHLPELESLSVKGCLEGCSEAVGTAMLGLRHAPRLQELSLSESSLCANVHTDGAQCMTHIVQGLAHARGLRVLRLVANMFPDAAMRVLAAALPQWPDLGDLYLAGNSFTEEGFRVIRAAASPSCRVYYFNR